LWGSDLSTGVFSMCKGQWKDRPHLALEFDGNIFDWLVAHNGRTHKWRGFFGWLFNAKPGRGLYNFEMVWLALLSAGIVNGRMPVRVTGLGLLNMILDHDRQINSGSHSRAINQILKAIGFSRSGEIAVALSGPNCVPVSNSIVNAILLATNKRTLSDALVCVSSSRASHGVVSGKLQRLMGFIERCNGSSATL
jgi:hypothetical protein